VASLPSLIHCSAVPYEGTIQLYDDGGTPRLVLSDPGASFRARVEPRPR
jgi:hypothetical protein